MPSALQRSLLATLAYFDLFDYPLTLMELRRYRYLFPDEPAQAEPSAAGMLAALDEGGVGERDGYWHLAGRAATVDARQRRYRLAEAKFKKAKAVARLLRLLPSVRLVAVCNSLAISNADSESDIDLFVVVRPGFIWATRLVVVGVLAALGLRPAGGSHADKVCMSFFVSENCLDLSRVAVGPEDTYLRYWIASLVPLYDAGPSGGPSRGAGGAFDAFLAKNAWVAERVPGGLGVRRQSAGGGQKRGGASPRWTAVLSPLLRLFEPAAKRLQIRLFPAEIKANANLDSRVVVSDDILKFHVTDRREEYGRRFRERLRELGIVARSDELLPIMLAHRSSLVPQTSPLRT